MNKRRRWKAKARRKTIVAIMVDAMCINGGERLDCECCPVALAMERAGFVAPDVGDEDAPIRGLVLAWRELDYRSGALHRFVVSAPAEVVRFVLDFDNERPVKPFSFKVDISKAVLSW